MGTEERLQDTWYGERSPGLLLSALERVYAGVSRARRERTTPAQDLVGQPIVVVGNITVGGTGKTPLVARLVSLLQARGLEVAVISRGYGRRSTEPVTVDAASTPEQGGDEPVLIARRCGVRVFVDTDREAAARAAFASGANVVLADDGLQRRRLPRAMEICVVDAARGLGNGRLLPAGPLREPADRLATVDQVIFNGPGTPPGVPPALVPEPLRMHLRPVRFRRLDSEVAVSAESARQQITGPLTAVAGMGNPERFFRTLEALGFSGFQRRSFPDHHAYTAGDIDALEGTVLMTEKDAVKCARFRHSDAWFLEVEAELPQTEENTLVEKIASLAGKID